MVGACHTSSPSNYLDNTTVETCIRVLHKAKGVSNLIEIENPNRVQKKTKKLSTLNTAELETKPQLSRREREEVEKQRAQAHYQKLHAEGKRNKLGQISPD
ncbi:hypothetical protein NQ317_011850 [Molorchus minor]|uniref:Casein kinase substrate phosphoprotein PP28 domain-containing protein n=1 Tax=Molorchus minor TaxID=1323400 RepID=A0ABQ9JMU2_9CUCU|nr:hypothetical protein NQ317_011850 [Molorchus minor]